MRRAAGCRQWRTRTGTSRTAISVAGTIPRGRHQHDDEGRMSETESPGDAQLYRMPARQRYCFDVEFRYLVDALEAMIHRAQFSPSELREAATFAAIRYEERNARTVYMRGTAEDGLLRVTEEKKL
jgi:hypothetical protein